MTVLSAQPLPRTKQALTIALSVCVAAAIILANNQVLAAEEDAKPITSEQAEERAATSTAKPAETDQKKQADKKIEKQKNKEVFRPSEEISEDYAVSFPVDI